MLDADNAIYALKGEQHVLSRVRQAGQGMVTMSALVHSQLLQGVPRRPNPELELA